MYYKFCVCLGSNWSSAHVHDGPDPLLHLALAHQVLQADLHPLPNHGGCLSKDISVYDNQLLTSAPKGVLKGNGRTEGHEGS